MKNPTKIAFGLAAALEPAFTWEGEAPTEAPAVTFISADEAVAAVDESGVAVGASAPTWDDSLASIAQSRCEDIAVDFSHNGAQTRGENIAVGYADAASVIAAWQASSGYYQNMISTGYTRGAIGHMYDGDGCHYWVAVFE